MKYKDDKNRGWVNGIPVGEKVGGSLRDADEGADPNDDSYNYVRGIVHVGTVLQDAADEKYNPYNPVPLDEDDETP